MEFVIFGYAAGVPSYLEECLHDGIKDKETALKIAESYKNKGYQVRIKAFNFSKPTNLVNDFINTINV